MTERVVTLSASRARLASGGPRLDRYLAAELPDLSRTQVQRLIEDGFVTVDQAPAAKVGLKLTGGEKIVVRIPPPAPTTIAAEPIALAVVYEDRDLIVIDKPAGMVVHPAAGHAGGTLVNAVLAHAPGLRGVGRESRPGIVHRLDKETSGLIVVAKDDRAHRHLQAQFKNRLAQKRYLALVAGRPPTPAGRVEAPIGRDPKNRKRMSVAVAGREAVTEYRTREAFQQFTFLEVEPKTGRTHQIRLHLSFLGCPVVGDRLYGGRRAALGLPGLKRHFLHAARLTLQLPSGTTRTFESELPADLAQVLAGLRAG